MVVFELDIPALTEDGIQLGYTFCDVMELSSLSMIDELMMIEMLMLLKTTFDISVILVSDSS